MTDLARARIGQTIGKYTLERLIGSGGTATVYEAVHRNANRVALKMLHAHLSVEAELRARFLREGYAANSVGHPGVVRVLDDDVTPDGAAVLVMELLDGQTVDALWEKRGRRLPPQEAARLGHELLDVLAAAHDKGIVHRDIKPENLFMTSDGVLKVLDFGIARLQESVRDGRTRTGRMFGTPGFMPPEQALGRSSEIDGRSDLWAVGATLFTLMSGALVHEGETVEELLVYAGSRPARSVLQAAPHVPPALARVVDRALRFNKGERWPGAREMQSALEEAYAQSFGLMMPGARSKPPTVGGLAFAATALAENVGSSALDVPRVPAHEPEPPTAPMGSRATSTTVGVTSSGARAHASLEPDDPVRLPVRRTAQLLALGLGVAAVVFTSGVGVLALRGGRGGAAPPETVSSAPQALPAPVATAATGASVSMTSDGPLPSAPVASSAADPPAVGTPSSTGPHGTKRGSPGAAPRPATPPAAPAANCNPPYTLDGRGHHVPKPECL